MVVFSVILKQQLVKREYSLKEQLRLKFMSRKQGAKVLASPEAAECVFHEKINGRGLMHSTGGEKALESRNY